MFDFNYYLLFREFVLKNLHKFIGTCLALTVICLHKLKMYILER